MSLARRHRERILAAQTVIAANADLSGGTVTAPAAEPLPAAGADKSALSGPASPADRAAQQIGLRYAHDLRRLKEIRSIDLKITAKRDILPDYREWIEGTLSADAGVGAGLAGEIVPTAMVWTIDIGDYEAAMRLGAFVLRHKVAMPSRYERDAATILVEEIADAAIARQSAGERFPIEVLHQVYDLTNGHDIHDPVRAKLLKAIGTEELVAAEEMEAGPLAQIEFASAAGALREAQRLNPRAGVTTKIKAADKAIAALAAAFPPAGQTEQGDTAP